MSSKNENISATIQIELDEFKDKLINSLLYIILIIGSVPLLISLVTINTSDQFPILSLPSYILIIIITIIRKRISYQYKTYLVILLGLFLGIGSLITDGLLSDGLLYILTTSVIASLILGTKKGFFVLIFSLISSFIIALLYANNILVYRKELVDYITSNSLDVWLIFIGVTLLFTSIVLFISHKINSYLSNNIHRLTMQSESLQNANIDLENEISKRRRMEYTLRYNENKLKNIFNSIQESILLINNKQEIIDVNPSFFRLSGYKKKDIVNKNISNYFTEPEKINAIFEKQQFNNFSIYKNETNIILKDNNEVKPVEVSLKSLITDGKDEKIMVVRDISDRKIQEKKILNAIIQTEEKERIRIAQDLHDDVGPLLSAIKLYMKSFNTNDKERLTHIKDNIENVLDESINIIKRIANTLNSHILHEQGLIETLEKFIQKIAESESIQFDTNFQLNFKPSKDIEITLYRVIVELINNTLKYASANTIHISIRSKKKNIKIKYSDDGKGFDLKNVLESKRGMGIINVNSRIDSLGGTLDLESKKGHGMSATINI